MGTYVWLCGHKKPSNGPDRMYGQDGGTYLEPCPECILISGGQVRKSLLEWFRELPYPKTPKYDHTLIRYADVYDTLNENKKGI